MKLTRTEDTGTVTFGTITDDAGAVRVNVTLEPSPVLIPPAAYPCRRYLSPHFGYELFRLYDVPGHDAIELHVGNSVADTHGCVLLGTERVGNQITESRKAFAEFMATLEGVDEFTLDVEAL